MGLPVGEAARTSLTAVDLARRSGCAEEVFEVMDIVRITDGQIVEHWGLVDQLGLLRQLGAAG